MKIECAADCDIVNGMLESFRNDGLPMRGMVTEEVRTFATVLCEKAFSGAEMVKEHFGGKLTLRISVSIADNNG